MLRGGMSIARDGCASRESSAWLALDRSANRVVVGVEPRHSDLRCTRRPPIGSPGPGGDDNADRSSLSEKPLGQAACHPPRPRSNPPAVLAKLALVAGFRRFPVVRDGE